MHGAWAYRVKGNGGSRWTSCWIGRTSSVTIAQSRYCVVRQKVGALHMRICFRAAQGWGKVWWQRSLGARSFVNEATLGRARAELAALARAVLTSIRTGFALNRMEGGF